MAKTKISEFSSTPGNNTDIDGINIAEGCAPSGINDAIRELMSQLKDFQTGAAGDSFNGPVGTTTAAAGAFTTLSASSTVTLSGGTANGIPYLNGSKVLTTGSALTFDGSTLNVNQALNVTDGTDTLRSVVASGVAYFGSSTNVPVAFRINSAEQMRLTSTGLGIGTSSPGAKLEVASGRAKFVGNSDQYNIEVKYNAATNGGWIGSPAGDTLAFYRGAGGAESGRFDSSGNLGIGTSSPTAKLHVVDTTGNMANFISTANGGGNIQLSCTNASSTVTGYVGSNAFFSNTWSLGTSTSTPVVFVTNGSERARIDSSGRLLVNETTNRGGRVQAKGEIEQVVYNSGSASARSSSWFHLYCTSSNYTALDAFIRSDGNFGSVSGVYGGTSDIKLKENITDTSPKLEKLLQVRVVNYNLKTNPDTRHLGVIAQELENVFPGLVEDLVDRDAEGNDLGTTTKSVKYSVFVPMLIKAIQEQQAIIEQLKADVAVLKSK